MQSKLSGESLEFTKQKIDSVLQELHKEITGQEKVIHQILTCLVSRGHILLEGMPGLAKTLLAKSLAKTLDLSFKRIQFTPDLLPADLIGTVVYNPKTSSFDTRKGPIFTGILLADEINRSPAKVQSALLQCMEEKSVTIGENTFELELPFIVIATENPIDQEGTYQLPEAQMDRFLMKIGVDYPGLDEEIAILSQHGEGGKDLSTVNKVLSKKEIIQISSYSDHIYVDPKLQEYIVKLVRNTRPQSTDIGDVKPYIRHGASPRASLAILRASRAHALLGGRDYVLPEDIKFSLFEILNHRVILTYEAMSEDIAFSSLLNTIVEGTRLP
ncbi:MAG: MoxR family ATPase [Leptospiraceae bacterium]|nr:MoxR family ATPase [Leptospiraceae bacterium]MCP5510875.1 MoxR family ATPase [Leptospiraceae bacterium]